MPCLVNLRERLLGPQVSALRSYVFELYAFESHISEPRSHILELHVSKPCTHAFEPRSFKPHPVGSLHFFNPDPASPDPCWRNICSVLATLVMRRVLKRASRRTYCKMVNIRNNTRLHQLGEMLSVNGRRSRAEVTWHDYGKGVRNLERCTIDFSRWVRNLSEDLMITCYM